MATGLMTSTATRVKQLNLRTDAAGFIFDYFWRFNHDLFWIR